MLPLEEVNLIPAISRKVIASISNIEAFDLFVGRYPFLGVQGNGSGTLDPISEGSIIPFGTILNTKEVRKPYYKLDIEGQGVGIVTDIVQKKPLWVVKLDILETSDEVSDEHRFKAKRIEFYCKHFLENNIPIGGESSYWGKRIQTLEQSIHFLAYVYLESKLQSEFLSLLDINEKIDFMLENIPRVHQPKSAADVTWIDGSPASLS